MQWQSFELFQKFKTCKCIPKGRQGIENHYFLQTNFINTANEKRIYHELVFLKALGIQKN